MGNTCVRSSRRPTVLLDEKVAPNGEYSVSSSISTDMGGEADPILGEFVAADDDENERPKLLGRFFCPTNPMSFVIVDKRSGLTILSVCDVGPSTFALTTPRGRSLGSLHVSKRSQNGELGWQFECDHLGYAADADSLGALNVYLGLQLMALIDPPAPVSILRGTDLVVLYLFQTVHDLLLCRKP